MNDRDNKIMEATKKQIAFIEVIAKKLSLDAPEDITKEEASDWIDLHMDEFHVANSGDLPRELF